MNSIMNGTKTAGFMFKTIRNDLPTPIWENKQKIILKTLCLEFLF